ncbi:hypothetical protein J3R30DRAFT_3399815 [Lentinula aciculospora]|uniref:Uncharacterized protein n=1 Tax=Lentinula aciculospora TaxID=153920 RepID=A0A9W9AW23_9AGAR|nr:hypothetical protein J3R30DRAFT_3399815 [Lentinula aciculospora]
MSVIQPTHSRPLDPLFLEDGLLSGTSIPSVGFGQSPESAMVEEIFNNPDVWSVQFDEDDSVNSGGAADFGPNSVSSMSSILGKGSTRGEWERSREMATSPGSSTKKKRSKSARLPEGYHLKRRSKLQLEAFTLKPFESRHRIMPYLSSASSMSDSPSIASSTPSLNSSLPTISDQDSVRSHLKSIPSAPVKWRGMQDTNEGPDLSLVALMEPSNNISPEAGERMSILWSHQNIFRAFPTPKGVEYEFREGSSGSQSSAQSIGSTMEAVTSAFPFKEEQGDSAQPGVMKPRRNVPPLTISTTTRMTTTTTTTVITVQSPARSSPASITVVSASATWSILELYGDSPKPSPKFPKLPKTSGHLDRSFKSSDLQLPSRPRLPPKSAFATNFPSQQLYPESATTATAIVELPADFVIPDLPRLEPKSKGPRIVPPSQMRITMVKDLDTPPLLEKDATVLRSRKNGKVRPLPQVPRYHSPPPPVPTLPTNAITLPLKTVTMLATGISMLPQPSNTTTHSFDSKEQFIMDPLQNPSSSHLLQTDKTHLEVSARGKKTALRSRMPPPPPLSLDSPLPPLPSDVEEPQVDSNLQKSKKLKALENMVSRTKEAEKDVTKLAENAHVRPIQKEGVPQLLRPPGFMADGAPARPSRKDVISPLPSPLLQRLHALESLPRKKNLSPPPISAHKLSVSGPSARPGGLDSVSPGPPMQLTIKRRLRKSSSISSMPKLTRGVLLPDASILAKRFPKDSAARARPPLESDLHIVVTASETQAKIGDESNASGLTNADAPSTSIPSLGSFIPPASTSLPAPVIGGHSSKMAASHGSSLYPPSVARKVEFPSLDRIPLNSTNLSASTALFPSCVTPLPTHRKGVSLSSADARPVFKVHKKSSSAASFRIPVVEHPFPDAATLAKRLVVRKDSNLKQPLTKGTTVNQDNMSMADRPYLAPSTSESAIPNQHQSNSLLKRPGLKSSSTDVDRNQAPAIPRPSHKKNASTSVLHQKSAAANRSIKKVSSHASLQSSDSFRRAITQDVPLPDASVLAQRTKVPSSRLYNNVSDAFTPSTMTADVSSPALPRTRFGQDVWIPLAAPELVVSPPSRAYQISKQANSSSHLTQAKAVSRQAPSTQSSQEVSRAGSKLDGPTQLHASAKVSWYREPHRRDLVS